MNPSIPRREVRHDGLLVAITRVFQKEDQCHRTSHTAALYIALCDLSNLQTGSLLLHSTTLLLSYSFVLTYLMSQSGDDDLWGDLSPSFEEQLYNNVALAEQAADLARQRNSLVRITTQRVWWMDVL